MDQGAPQEAGDFPGRTWVDVGGEPQCGGEVGVRIAIPEFGGDQSDESVREVVRG